MNLLKKSDTAIAKLKAIKINYTTFSEDIEKTGFTEVMQSTPKPDFSMVAFEELDASAKRLNESVDQYNKDR